MFMTNNYWLLNY